MVMPQKLEHGPASFRAYAKTLSEAGWCIDESGLRSVLLHIRTGRSKTLDALPRDYLDWALTAGIEIGDGRYGEINATASTRICQNLVRVAGSTFLPVDQPIVDEDGVMLANRFKPYKPERLVSERHAMGVALVEEYFERLFPVAEERHWVRQYLAHALLRPLVRPQLALIVTGEPGTGKSLLIRCIEVALGGRHCWQENDYSAAFGRFSQVFADHLIVAFDDAPVMAKTEEQMKYAITRSTQEIEVKGVQQPIKRRVFSRVIVLSNDRRPFSLEGDRRYFIPQHCVHRAGKLDTNEFFHRFVPWIQSADAGPTVYHWLCETSLEGFSESAPPMTETKRRLMAGASGVAEAIGVHVADDRILHSKEVESLALQMGLEEPSAAEISEAMTRLGYDHRRRSHPTRKGQIWLWVPRRNRRNAALNEQDVERLRRVGALD